MAQSSISSNLPLERTSEPLIKTKLAPPKMRASLVSRPRLLKVLSESGSCALTLICAPPGYGKTTILEEWIGSFPEDRKPPICWLSLDEGDNDPVRFLNYLVAALNQADAEIGHQAESMLHAFPPPPAQAVLTLLINHLEELSAPVFLVLDDYQFISTSAIHTGLAFLLEHLPANLHLMLSTRSDPPLPLSRLRARNQLIELRAENLRFTPEEASAFLRQVMQLPISQEDILTLEARTEGWVTGLQMAALALRGALSLQPGHTDVSGFIQAFSGSHRYILDYLTEEVLSRQPEKIQRFLLYTSILDRFCASLCAALGEENEAFAQHILETLEEGDLFLIALDNERGWYRYHHLFRDLLKSRFLLAYPDLVRELNSRASGWFESHGYLTEAIQYALAAQDHERAADLIERYGPSRWFSSDPSVIMLSGELPAGMYRAHTKLGIYQAWLLITQGKLQPAMHLVNQLRKDISSQEQNEQLLWMQSFVDLLAAYASQQPKEQVSIPLPDEKVFDYIPDLDRGLHSTADYLYAILLNRRGEFQRAGDILVERIERDTAAYGTLSISLAVPLLARIWMMLGRLHEAADLCRKYLAPISENRKSSFYIAGALHIILGEALFEWNDLENAEQHIRKGLRANEPWQNITMDTIGYSDLINVLQAREDLDGARQAMQDLEARMQGRAEILDIEEELITIKVRLWLACGELARVEEWARRLSGVEPSNYLQGWEHVTLARVRYIQGHYKEAEQVLNTLSCLPGAQNRTMRQMRIDLLLALTLFAQGKQAAAFHALEACLLPAERGEYLRLFLECGEPARKLLSAYLLAPGTKHQEYIRKIILSFSNSTVRTTPEKQINDLPDALTPREQEVLQRMVEGLSNRQIADQLILSEGTIKFYVHAILEKLQVHSRTQAIKIAREKKLI